MYQINYWERGRESTYIVVIINLDTMYIAMIVYTATCSSSIQAFSMFFPSSLRYCVIDQGPSEPWIKHIDLVESEPKNRLKNLMHRTRRLIGRAWITVRSLWAVALVYLCFPTSISLLREPLHETNYGALVITNNEITLWGAYDFLLACRLLILTFFLFSPMVRKKVRHGYRSLYYRIRYWLLHLVIYYTTQRSRGPGKKAAPRSKGPCKPERNMLAQHRLTLLGATRSLRNCINSFHNGEDHSLFHWNTLRWG